MDVYPPDTMHKAQLAYDHFNSAYNDLVNYYEDKNPAKASRGARLHAMEGIRLLASMPIDSMPSWNFNGDAIKHAATGVSALKPFVDLATVTPEFEAAAQIAFKSFDLAAERMSNDFDLMSGQSTDH